MQKKVNETEVSMDIDTFNKVRGKLKPTDKVDLTDKKPQLGQTSSSTSMTSVSEDGSDTVATTTPEEKPNIKYLSNVKDNTTGEVSKPFVIGDKRYQMIRGITPSKEVVMGVYCHDELDESGENIIHPVDHFEQTIAKPFLNKAPKQDATPNTNINPSHNEEMPAVDESGQESKFANKEALMDYLNLVGLEGYKHFFVNIKTGAIDAKFKTTKEMIKSRIKLGPEDDYMDVKTLKRFRFGDYFKTNVNEEAPINPEDAGTDVSKLQSDVKKLTNLIKNKFSVYLSKLDKPIEQSQFLIAMAGQIGVPLNKLSSIISSYRDISQDGKMDKPNVAGLKAESKIITKKELDESIFGKKVIKTVKVKDIK